MPVPALPDIISRWFAARGWRVRQHQAEMVAAAEAGQHALLVAATGAGKTLAGFLPMLADLARNSTEGLHTLYVSPLKALAADVERNLLTPIAEMGLPIRVETRTGDTSSDKKARQRAAPPQILLTTPESLSLLLSYPDSDRMFAGLKTIVIDEVHAFASGKRGDLLALAMARLQTIVPEMRRVALSATIGDSEDYRRWLAPDHDPASVALVAGEPGAKAHIEILTPEGRVPWSGHSGRYAASQVYREIERHRLTLVFCNTRSLAELVFNDLWAVNEATLPIGLHHGSLSKEARQKVEGAMADGRLRALVCTASLDLGVDWGDVDLVVQMGAPKGSSRLIQRIGRANHRLDEASEAIVVPGNRFEYLEARAALDAIDAGELDTEPWRPGALDVLAQHLMACACAEPFDADAMFDEVLRAAPYAALTRAEFDRVLNFVADGGYALRAYDRYKRLTRNPDGRWRVSHPSLAKQHRLNAGIIVEAPMLDVRFGNGRMLGRVEEYFASTLSPGDTFRFAGLALEVERIVDTDLIVTATRRAAMIPSYMGARLPLSTHLADRVRGFLADPAEWRRFPPDVAEWLEVQQIRSVLPQPGELLIETFPHDGLHHMIAYSFEGWNAHQSLGMLLTRRMETLGLQPTGFVANDYALGVYGLKEVRDPAPLFSPDILEDELAEWVQTSHLLKRAFREVAVIGGLIERQHPGKRKSGRQVTFSTDLIYDVLRKYEPDHMLLRAAWEDARLRLTDVARLANLLDRAASSIVHKRLDRVSPLAVPVLVMIGRESVAQGLADEALLIEAEALAEQAMRSLSGTRQSRTLGAGKDRMRTLSWLAALLFITPAVAAASVVPQAEAIPPAESAAPPPESLSFAADKSLRMTVPVSIGGKGPFDFVVDTGAERTVISEELAGALGLGSTGTAEVHSISGIERFNTVMVPSLSVTSTPVRNVTAPLIKRRDLGAAGLLGIDSLQSKTVLIDFARQTMTVSQARQAPVARADEDETIVVRARNRLGRLILVDAAIGGRKIAVVIDTGAEHSVGNPMLRRRVIGKRGNTFVVPTNLYSVTGGIVPAEIALVDELRIGSMTLTRMPIAFADLEVFRQLGLDRKPAMLLGMNTLRAFEQVSVDFANKTVRFVVPGESGRDDDTRLASAASR